MAYGDVKQKIAQQKDEFDNQALMCSAHGCHQRWMVGPEKLCSYHAWEDPKKWPRITDELNRLGPWQLQRFREVDTTVHKGHPKAWAMRLQERHQSCERLSRIQIEFYQVALRLNVAKDAA
jgi:hypothetical protein